MSKTASNENKNDRFKRIATKRTQNVLRSIKALAKCSNNRNYNYTENDVRKIFNAVQIELKLSKALFQKNISRKSNEFTL